MTDPTPDAAPPTEAAEPDAPAHFVRGLYAIDQAAQKGSTGARASLARLRRAAGRGGVDYAALAEIGHLLPSDAPLSDDALDAYLLVAALYALQASGSGETRGARDKTSFGGSARWLRRELSVGQGSLDLRFGALLDARRQDLPYRLRQIVTLMSTRPVGVRYDQLLRDLLVWDDPDRSVQRRWARDYWTGSRPS